MCGFLIHHSISLANIFTKKHLIKWAAIYTIVTYKFPKVLEIMNTTYQAPRRLIKSAEDIEKMRIAGRLAAEVLDMIKPHIKPGVTTLELDTICHDYIVNVQNAIPACLGYGAAPGRPAFQHTICTSVNHVVCHGIPSENKILKKAIF